MKPEFSPEGLKKTRPWEYALRFGFGGVVTAATGVIAHAFGPVVGGLFLAFPAILPASLTLVQQHDGRRDAVDDARGACLGSIGLAAFALTTWGLATRWPAVAVLAVATLVWTVVAIAAWGVAYGWRRPARTRAPRRTVAVRMSRSARS